MFWSELYKCRYQVTLLQKSLISICDEIFIAGDPKITIYYAPTADAVPFLY